jgi:hypothetical protein
MRPVVLRLLIQELCSLTTIIGYADYCVRLAVLCQNRCPNRRRHQRKVEHGHESGGVAVVPWLHSQRWDLYYVSPPDNILGAGSNFEE